MKPLFALLLTALVFASPLAWAAETPAVPAPAPAAAVANDAKTAPSAAVLAVEAGKASPNIQPSAPPLKESLEKSSQKPFLERLWTLTGVFHPATVHFPIAMLCVSAMFVLLRWKFKNISEDVGFYALLLGAASTVPATLMGWAFSYQMGYGNPLDSADNEVFFHRWGGILLTVLAVGCAFIAIRERYFPSEKMRRFWHAGVIVSAVLVGLVGHWGGSLTYGEDMYAKATYTFMGWDWNKNKKTVKTEPANPPVTNPHSDNGSNLAVTGTNPSGNGVKPANPATGTGIPPTAGELGGGDPKVAFFISSVKPILEAHCIKCHGAEKQKGKYALHTREEALAPDKAGEVRITPGKSSESTLIQLIKSSEMMEVMPPEDESKLTADEIAILAKWIDEGAHWAEGFVLKPEK